MEDKIKNNKNNKKVKELYTNQQNKTTSGGEITTPISLGV